MSTLADFALVDRVAIVTGAAQGLGLAMAEALAGAGASIVIADKNRELAESAAAGLRQCDWNAIALAVDVTVPEQVTEMVEATVSEYGRLDILVNNAGIDIHSPAESMPYDVWRRIIDVNLTGVFLCAQAAGREMIRRGRGSIVNVASMSAFIVNNPPPQCAYNASKGGVVMLTKSLAAEWARLGIRVNAIAPGYMRTELTAEYLDKPEYGGVWLADTPMGRAGLPAELGGAVVYLASDASSFVTGHTLVIDGGFTVW